MKVAFWTSMPTQPRVWFKERMEQSIKTHPLLAVLYPLVRHSSVYLVGTALVGAANFVLVPLYTRFLNPTDFGIYALIESTLVMAMGIAQLGLAATYLRWHVETESERRGELLGSSASAVILVAATLGILLVTMADSLGVHWLNFLGWMKWVLPVILVLRSLQGLFFSVLQASQRPAAYVYAAVARLVTLALTGTWFVALHHEGLQGVVRSWLISESIDIFILFGCIMTGSRVRLAFRWTTLQPLLKYGVPLIWSSFMAQMLDASGRFFLARERNLTDVAVYVVGIKIANIAAMGFLQPFSSAWAGIAFPLSHRPNAPMTYTKVLSYAFVAIMLLIAILILFGSFIVRIFAGKTYIVATSLLPWLLLPVALRLFEYWSSLPLYLKYKTHWLGPIVTVGVGVCLGLNALLVPRWGALGSAVAWVGALVTNVILMALVSRKYYPLPIDVKTIGFAVALWLIAAMASRILLPLTSAVALGVALAAALLLALACIGYFRMDVRASRRFFQEGAYAD